MKNTIKKIASISLLSLLIAFPALAEFNPNRIISDETLLDYDSMDLDDIQSFLESKNSFLATYSTINAHGTVKPVSEMIYDATHDNYDCDGVTLSDNPTEAEKDAKCRHITTVNPKFLLVLLQKEASLIEDPSPIQSHLDWATGYGCSDGLACIPYYKGIGKQINSASLQFLEYFNNPSRYKYKVGQTYVGENKYSGLKTIAEAINDGTYNKIAASPDMVVVTPENQATAALYIYTPHVYNGNYNTYTLWNRYFDDSSDIDTPIVRVQKYGNGALLQAKGEPGIWLIENGLKRPFLNYSAFISRFDKNKVISVDKKELDNYDKGAPIRFANYSLVQDTDGGLYLIVDNQKRKFTSQEVFKQLGFNKDEIIVAAAGELDGYNSGANVTATSSYPTGALLQDIKTGGVYYVENGFKYPIPDKAFLISMFKGRQIIKTSGIELGNYQTGPAIMFSDGELLKSNNSPAVYLIENGQKRLFISGNSFEGLGYSWDNVVTVSPQLLAKYGNGQDIGL
jgi:hypothetical protein